MVVALLALFVALGGGAYAAVNLPNNSVGTKQIKNNAVTGGKVKNGSLTGSDIKTGSLTGAVIQLSALGTVPSATNATNATNAAHASVAGSATALGAVTYVKGATVSVPANSENSATATCPSGTFPIGGGAYVDPGSPDPYINSSFPLDAPSVDADTLPDSWKEYIWNPTSLAHNVRPFVVCTAVTSPTANFTDTSATAASRR